jgi:F0F1-type ATP synthase membrane subunit a
MFDLFRLNRQPVDVAPPTLVTVGGIPVVNTLVTAVMVTVVLAVAGLYLRSHLRLIPGGFQNWMEYLYEHMLNLINQITSNKQMAKQIFPLVASLLCILVLLT